LIVSKTKDREKVDISYFRSFVPGTVYVPEEEFQELYALYAASCQTQGKQPLSPLSFISAANIMVL